MNPPDSNDSISAGNHGGKPDIGGKSRVFVVDDLPRNAMGKVQKLELRNRYSSLFAK